MPDTYSAAVTARVVSRLLNKRGLPMSQKGMKHRLTKGLYVHRIGYSNTVVVSYWMESLRLARTANEQEKDTRKEVLLRATSILQESGYAVEQPLGWSAGLYIHCERE